MPLTTEQCLAAIVEHSAGLARTARHNLTAQVEHCPDWNVADLVWHVSEVHWFWGTIAADRLQEPPAENRRPNRPADADLVDAFEVGAQRLVDVLRAADQSDKVWTWAPAQQDVAFITRHQVQEAAVHGWDAANAAGASMTIAPDVAADSVDEFLTFSISTDADPAEPARPSLEGGFGLRTTDHSAAWTLSDGKAPGAIRVTEGITDDVPVIDAPASDLLLWLYRRADIDTAPVPDVLVARFRALTFTD